MTQVKEYSDIPGTYVFDGEHSRKGYHLNMFCMSLNKAENRKSFGENEAVYLERYSMSEEQRQAVLKRDWLGMLQLGGNIYYTFKLAIFDGLTMQQVGARMSGAGMSDDEFVQMMINGGRSIDGNRYVSESAAEPEHG